MISVTFLYFFTTLNLSVQLLPRKHGCSRTWTNGVLAPDNGSIAVNATVETEQISLQWPGNHDFDPIAPNIAPASFGSVVTRGDAIPKVPDIDPFHLRPPPETSFVMASSR